MEHGGYCGETHRLEVISKLTAALGRKLDRWELNVVSIGLAYGPIDYASFRGSYGYYTHGATLQEKVRAQIEMDDRLGDQPFATLVAEDQFDLLFTDPHNGDWCRICPPGNGLLIVNIPKDSKLVCGYHSHQHLVLKPLRPGRQVDCHKLLKKFQGSVTQQTLRSLCSV